MRPTKYDYERIYQLAFIEGYTPKEIAEHYDMPNSRQIRKILKQRAEEVIRPERKPTKDILP